ncbi:hypothetical protein HNV11_21475 [Spirosoma taeanense]|uniref:Uncharacterized protein n=1 Tax=Spirosoma taeanense TaxID=2735870 RepID=A0A6M5YEN5_9BACT|nr:hypothetical protein [Spirosoma taeanense]QJW91766.1 hypothetical protein HNV11_21475 [Spirosoma taeanense]
MRCILTFLVLTGLFSNCGSRSTRPEAPATTTDTAGTRPSVAPSGKYCFRQVVGRDTTFLRLVINGSNVTGELAVRPYEKDRAGGPIRGTLSNNQIQADWKRSGEGVTQPYELVFTLRGDTISWHEGERVEQEGKWVLKNPDEGYQYTLTKVNCK